MAMGQVNKEMTSLDEEFEDIRFDVKRSARYHNARRRFFEFLDKTVTACALIFSSATVYTILTEARQSLTAAVAAFVTVITTITLVFDAGRKARDHEEFAKKYIQIEKEMDLTDKPSKNDIKRWKTQLSEISKAEPPIKIVLDAIMHNDLLRAEGYERKYFLKIGWFQKLVAQVTDVRLRSIRTYDELMR